MISRDPVYQLIEAIFLLRIQGNNYEQAPIDLPKQVYFFFSLELIEDVGGHWDVRTCVSVFLSSEISYRCATKRRQSKWKPNEFSDSIRIFDIRIISFIKRRVF